MQKYIKPDHFCIESGTQTFGALVFENFSNKDKIRTCLRPVWQTPRSRKLAVKLNLDRHFLQNKSEMCAFHLAVHLTYLNISKMANESLLIIIRN